MLTEYHGGRLTQREFVEQNDLSLATLTKWLRQEREAAPAPSKAMGFAELPLAQALGAARWTAEIVRPDGWIVRLAHDAPAGWVAQLLRPC